MFELKVKYVKPIVRTRTQRKAAVASVIRQLDEIRNAESKCLDNTPDNFLECERYYIGCNAVESINIALDFLADVYGSDKHSIIHYHPEEHSFDEVPF